MMKTSLCKWLIANVGACPTCMRQSFVTALFAATVALSAWLLLGSSLTTTLLISGAVGMALLWVVHLFAYAWKVSAKTHRTEYGVTVLDHSRRAFIPTFAKVFIGVALATALPVRPAWAVTCASDEWCCRHDFNNGGVCVKCCPKPKN